MRKSHAGFTLVELMVVVGIGSIIAVAMTSLFTNMFKGAATTKYMSEAQTLNDEMQAMLGNSISCANTFDTQYHPSLTLPDAPAVVTISEPINTIQDASTAPGNPAYVKNFPYGSGSLMISDLQLVSYKDSDASRTSGIGSLLINYKAKGQVNGSPVTRNYINIQFTKNPTSLAIEGCVALSKMNSDIWTKVPGTVQDILYSGGLVGIGPNAPTVTLDINRSPTVNTLKLGGAKNVTLTDSTVTTLNEISIQSNGTNLSLNSGGGDVFINRSSGKTHIMHDAEVVGGFAVGGGEFVGGNSTVNGTVTANQTMSVASDITGGGSLKLAGNMAMSGGGNISGLNGNVGIGNVGSGWYSDPTNLAARAPAGGGNFIVQAPNGSANYLIAGPGQNGVLVQTGDLTASNNLFVGNVVGVKTSNPKAVLDVNGTIRVGTSGDGCGGSNEGAMKYDAGSHSMKVCSGNPLSWASLGGKPKQNESLQCCRGPGCSLGPCGTATDPKTNRGQSGNHDLCILQGEAGWSGGFWGACFVEPVGNGTWFLYVSSEGSHQVTCRMSCYDFQ